MQPNPTTQADELQIAELVWTLLRHRVIFGSLIVAAVAGTLCEHFFFPSYRARSSVYIQSLDNSQLQALASRMNGLSTGGGNGNGGDFPEKYMVTVESHDFFVRTARELHKSPDFNAITSLAVSGEDSVLTWVNRLFEIRSGRREVPEPTDEDLAGALARWVHFSRASSDEMGVSVITPRPSVSMTLTNFVVSQAVDTLNDYDMKELNEAEDYLRAQIDRAEQKINDTTTQLIRFRKGKHGGSMNVTAGSESQSDTRLTELQHELEMAKLEYQQNLKLITSLEPQAQRQGAAGGETQFGAGRRIEELKRQNQFYFARTETIRKLISQLVESQDPREDQQVFDFRKRVELQYSFVQELQRELFQLDMQRISVKNQVRGAETVRYSDVSRTVGIGRKLIFALLAALMVAIPIAFLWEKLFPKIRSRQELETLGLPVLGVIPELPTLLEHDPASLRMGSRGAKPPSPFCRFDIDSEGSIALKHLRTRLQHLSTRSKLPIRIVSVVSSQLEEGKSCLSRNLAASMAGLNRRTLLVDCDLRKATNSSYFVKPMDPGLGELLQATPGKQGDPNLEEEIEKYIVRDIAPNLDLLPAGPARTGFTDLLASDRFSELLQLLRIRYESIWLDTPAISAGPDAILTARHADLVLLVVDAGHTPRETVGMALDYLIDIEPERIFGVLNRDRSRARMPSYVASPEDLYLIAGREPPPSSRTRKPAGDGAS